MPEAVGPNTTAKVSCCPGANVVPEARPVVDHSGLEMLTELIVTEALPVFLTVPGRARVDWRATVPNERAVGFNCQAADAVWPVPWTATVVGEDGTPLVIVRVALAVAVLEAVNETVKVWLAPGAS